MRKLLVLDLPRIPSHHLPAKPVRTVNPRRFRQEHERALAFHNLDVLRLAERHRARTHRAIAHFVVDLFGGSGSTLIACERRRRTARLMEIDPKYADCIVRRWQDYTGRQAVLDGDGRSFDDVARERVGAVE